MKKRLRWILASIGVVGVIACVWLWPAIRVLLKVGLPESPEMRQYAGTSADNLKAIRTALMLYHDNEDRFPEASGWMDAIEKQLKTNDLTPEEAAKKLRNPARPDTFGYALADSAAAKHRDDIPKTDSVLVFESESATKNAHGDPNKATGQAITLEGTIVQLR